MSSILTNTSAMVALQTLKGINSSLAKTQDEISTGKSVASAKDNASVWAISKAMEADVKGFNGIADSLSQGEATVAVARQAAETITDLLTDVKDKIVAANAAGADKQKIQTDIVGYIDQIKTIVGSAQLNGTNLIKDGAAGLEVLASLDRSGSDVTVSNISVAAKNLAVGDYVAKAAFTGSDGVTNAEDAAAFGLDATTGTGTLVVADGAGFVTGDSISITVGGKTATYTVTAQDAAATTPADMVAVGLKNAIDKLGISGLTVDYDSATPGTLAFANEGGADLTVNAQFANAGSGGLGLLDAIDVTSATGATDALTLIEPMIQTAIDAAASFGSAEKRISTQSDFVSKLVDSIETGIGAMVDADMEEASARLQALQVQQQLGIQSLSIANQAPQNILSLFQ